MKRLLTLLLILISLSLSQEPINYETTLIERDGAFYTKDTNKPYSGPVFSLYDDGKKNKEGTFKDGKRDGEYTYYDKNGKIYWKGIYKDDVLVNETSFIGSKGPFLLN